MINLEPGSLDEIAVLGAHCDDIGIGMGATLLSLTRSRPGLRVNALVLSGAGTAREAEERAALEAFCPDAEVSVTILDIPDGRSPVYWEKIKEALHEFRIRVEPDVVFATGRHDAHQDHRTLAELVPTEFRDHLVLGYEILKWETDTPTPTVFVPVGVDAAADKVALLHKYYPSQIGKDWFDDESFLGLLRIRGVQCKSRYAEAFTVEKMLVTLGGGCSERK